MNENNEVKKTYFFWWFKPAIMGLGYVVSLVVFVSLTITTMAFIIQQPVFGNCVLLAAITVAIVARQSWFLSIEGGTPEEVANKKWLFLFALGVISSVIYYVISPFFCGLLVHKSQLLFLIPN